MLCRLVAAVNEDLIARTLYHAEAEGGAGQRWDGGRSGQFRQDHGEGKSAGDEALAKAGD